MARANWFDVPSAMAEGGGRAAMLTAGILAVRGLPIAAAFVKVAAARGCPVPDTPGQLEWNMAGDRTPPEES